MTAAAIPYLLAASSAVTAVKSSQAQATQYKAEAKVAENDAKAKTIERKRALIETLAMQNVGAAAQGRTISSIAGLQTEDKRRSNYSEKLSQGNLSEQLEGLSSAASSAKESGYISAGSSLLSGGYKASKTG